MPTLNQEIDIMPTEVMIQAPMEDEWKTSSDIVWNSDQPSLMLSSCELLLGFEKPRRRPLEDDWRHYFFNMKSVLDWGKADYDEIRSYSLSVAESFQNAARECPEITVSPDVMGGAPCVAGTRIPVYMILDAVVYYGSPDGVLESYPSLTVEQVMNAIGFAKIVVECPLADDEP